MRRLLLSLALLAALAGVGAWNAWHMESVCGEVCVLLVQGVRAAEEGNWGRAEALSQQGLERWQEELGLLHTLSRHDNLRAVTDALEEALALARWQSGAEYAASAARAQSALRAMEEGERLTLGNVL